jgi:hypothetical protein
MRLFLITLFIPFAVWAGEPMRLPVEGLGFDFVFTGIAGIPLGQTFEIEATAVADPERDAPKASRKGYLSVTSVNGRKLKKAEEIPLFGDYTVPRGVVFHLTVVEDARYELFTGPNLSNAADWRKHTRQRMFSGLRIVKQLTPATPVLKEEQKK